MTLGKKSSVILVSELLSLVNNTLEVNQCFILRGLHSILRMNKMPKDIMENVLDGIIHLLLHPNSWIRKTVIKILLDFQQQGEKGNGEIYAVQLQIITRYPLYFKVMEVLDSLYFTQNIITQLSRAQFDGLLKNEKVSPEYSSIIDLLPKQLSLIHSQIEENENKIARRIKNRYKHSLDECCSNEKIKIKVKDNIDLYYSELYSVLKNLDIEGAIQNKYQTYAYYESRINIHKNPLTIEMSSCESQEPTLLDERLYTSYAHNLYFNIKLLHQNCDIAEPTIGKQKSQEGPSISVSPHFHFRNILLNSYYEHHCAVNCLSFYDDYFCTCDCQGKAFLWRTANILSDRIGYSEKSIKISDGPIISVTPLKAQDSFILLAESDSKSNITQLKLDFKQGNTCSLTGVKWIQSIKSHDSTIGCIGNNKVILFDIRENRPSNSVVMPWKNGTIACYDYDDDEQRLYVSSFNGEIYYIDIRMMSPSLFCNLPDYSPSIAVFKPGNQSYLPKDTYLLVSRPMSATVALDIYNNKGLKGSLITSHEINNETLLDSFINVENDLIEGIKKRLLQSKKQNTRKIYAPSCRNNNRHVLCGDEEGRVHYWVLDEFTNVDFTTNRILKKEEPLAIQGNSQQGKVTGMMTYDYLKRTYLITTNDDGVIRVWI